MTVLRRKVAREPAPEPREAAAIVELQTLIGGQREATVDLRERVKVLESELKHYATKADLANAKAGVVKPLLSVIVGLLTALVTLGIAFFRLSSGN